MTVRLFLSVVPRSFKTAAAAFGGFAVLAGLVVMLVQTVDRGPISLVASAAQGLACGLIGAVIVVPWILCLGYVYADAQRRSMPPGLWALVAALIPNLLGFLLYFACRRPISMPCMHCGQPVAPNQKFCPACGHPGSSNFSTPIPA